MAERGKSDSAAVSGGAKDLFPFLGGGFGRDTVPEFGEVTGDDVAALGTGVALENVAPRIVRHMHRLNETAFAKMA